MRRVNMKNKKQMNLKLATLLCKESVVIYGRNENGEADRCFQKGKEYLFCVDEKKGEIFTLNDVKEVHFLSLSDYYTDKHFKVLTIKDIEKYDLDEFTLNRMKKLYKEKYHYEE